MKLLILSCNTGQGHNAAGKAVAEEFGRRGVTWEMRDVMQFAGAGTSKRVEEIYVKVTTKTPWLFQGAYKAGEWISSSRRKSPVYLANIHYARSLYDYIRREKMDGVVMPHLFPAETLTYIRRHIDRELPCYGIATDYTCIPFWEETELDYYFVPPLDAGDSFAGKGIAKEKLIPTGIPVSARFYEKTEQAEARKRLHLPLDRMIFLVMTGSMGYGDTAELVEALAAQGGADAAVLIMTGRNTALRQDLEQRTYGSAWVKAMPYTDQISLYMDACDVLLTKPGGLTSTEAAVKQVPMIHTKPIPGCETVNADFFSSYGMAICAADTATAAREALALAGDRERQEEMKKRQRAVIPARAAERICDFIVRNLEHRVLEASEKNGM